MRGRRRLRLLLVDDHAVLRQGLRALLESSPDCEVIGEASDGRPAADMVERLRPDVVVMDLMMPGVGGLEATRQLKARRPETQVVILSMHDGPGYEAEARREGASGYVRKDAAAARLIEAVRAVASGRRFFSHTEDGTGAPARDRGAPSLRRRRRRSAKP